MNRREPLIFVAEPAVVSSGLLPDRHALFSPLWTVGENVRFYQGKVRRLVPAAQAFTTAAEVSRGLHQQQVSSGTRYVFTATFDSGSLDIYRWFGPAATNIGSIAGAVKNQSSTTLATFADFVTWGNWTIVNTGVGAPQLFDPSGPTFDDLANAPTDAVMMLKKENQLLAIGHGLTHKQVSWSDADDITNWTPATDSLAGSFTIEELDTAIRSAARLGANIAVYAEDQMAFVSRVGAPFHFGQRVMLDGIGAVGKAAVTSDGRMNYGVSRNGIWRTDGADYQYIDAGRLNDYLQENVNWDQASKIVAARNDVNRTFEFHFPMGAATENSEGWSFDPAEGGWTQIPAFQSVMERRLFDKPLAAKGGTVYLLDDDPEEAAPLALETKPMLVEAGGRSLHATARIDEVEIAAKAATNVQFRYSVAEDIDGPWNDLAWQNLSTDLRTYQLEASPTGTFHKLTFQSTADEWELDLQGFALFGIIDGGKRTAL